MENVVLDRRGGGFAVTALVCGIVGVVFGMIPLFFIIALALGLTGLAFGVVGAFPRPLRPVMAWIGVALSAIAVALGCYGAVVVNDAVDEIDRILTTEK